jgi:hypothetical protein
VLTLSAREDISIRVPNDGEAHMAWHYKPDRPFNAGYSWSKREDEILVRYHGSLTTETLADRLGRSYSGVRSRMKKLGLLETRICRYYTPQEDDLIRQHYGERGAARRLADQLKRTRDSIIGRAHRLQLSAGGSPS